MAIAIHETLYPLCLCSLPHAQIKDLTEGVEEGTVWDGGGHRYHLEKVVGNGAFGIVWRAREEGSSESVAIKKVVLDRRYHNRELEMMKGLNHEFVIKLHHSFEKPYATHMHIERVCPLQSPPNKRLTWNSLLMLLQWAQA